MDLKKNKIIIIFLAIFLLLIISLVAILIIAKLEKKPANNVPAVSNVAPVSELDKFIENQKGFMTPDSARKRGLHEVEMAVPFETKTPIAKITIVPKVASGGDAIYEPIAQTTDGNFQVLDKSALAKLFIVKTPEESLKYLDFMMVKMGSSAYDRFKQTVRTLDDYKKRVCKDKNNKVTTSGINPLPITQSKVVAGGFEVTWVYYSPTVPAGYWKKVYLITQDGDIQLKENPDKPFWPCGVGRVY